MANPAARNLARFTTDDAKAIIGRPLTDDEYHMLVKTLEHSSMSEVFTECVELVAADAYPKHLLTISIAAYEDDGCCYTLTYPDGKVVLLGDAENQYQELAGIIDDQHDKPIGHRCPPVHRRDNARCEAVISAVENLRDGDIGGHPVVLSDIWREAEGYIRDGLSTCTCPQP